jgi:hypothetical protein
MSGSATIDFYFDDSSFLIPAASGVRSAKPKATLFFSF